MLDHIPCLLLFSFLVYWASRAQDFAVDGVRPRVTSRHRKSASAETSPRYRL